MDRIVILILALAFATIKSEETYANSSHICEKCHCNVDEPDQFLLDCSHQKFDKVLANWPPHNGTLLAVFSHNNITTLGVMPPSDKPAKLVFDHCNIKYLDPRTFANIRDVELIDLSYNLLTTEEIDGEDFKGPYNKSVSHPLAIKYLNLAFNLIHSLPRKFFESMSNLEELNLAGNNLQVLDDNTQKALSSLTKLKVLNISHNKLTELVGNAVTGLVSLEEIDLSYNHIDFVPDTLALMQKTLTVVRLSGNLIYHVDDKTFLGLNLLDVYLSALPRLKSVGPNAFAPMPNLRKVEMCNNVNLRSIDREAFSPKHNLQELYLNNNSIYDLDFNMLSWSTLRIFEINDNPLTCACALFNITQKLSVDITNNLDGPSCMDISNHVIQPIYSLQEDICVHMASAYTVEEASQHFEIVRITVITLCSLLTLATLAAMAIGVLRYRRRARNYPFTAQVAYNRISRQFTM